MAKRINNYEARQYVNQLQEFRGSNLYSCNRGDLYIVYSYGSHWPLYAYDRASDQWYGNSDKYSHTTSTHAGRACPSSANIRWLGVRELQAIIQAGGAGQWVIKRMTERKDIAA